MRQLFKYFILCSLTYISFVASGQTALDGTYERYDTSSTVNSSINKMTLIIAGDSIWFAKNRKTDTDNKFFSNFFIYEGTIHRYTDFYLASLILMECDTCPLFWKYTTKSEDSIGIEIIYSSDKFDTVITNDDTSYNRAETLSDKDGNIEVRRIAELFFTITTNQDLLLNGKLYRRKRSK